MPLLTNDDIDAIVEGIEHFIIGYYDRDGELLAIWQPYIDKLRALKGAAMRRCTCGVVTGGARARNPTCEVHGDAVPAIQTFNVQL